MATSSMIHVRLDDQVKEAATVNLEKMGLSVSDAVRMMLVRVAVEKALPFEVRVPNAKTAKAMRDSENGKGKRFQKVSDLFEDLGI